RSILRLPPLLPPAPTVLAHRRLESVAPGAGDAGIQRQPKKGPAVHPESARRQRRGRRRRREPCAGVEKRRRKRRPPEVTSLGGRAEPQLVLEVQTLELLRELERPVSEDATGIPARRDVDADSARRRPLSVPAHEQARIVGGEVESVRMYERPVAEDWGEVALPGPARAEQARMSETDVDGTEPAGAETLEGTSITRRDSREMRIDPRNDVLDQVALPDPGPLAPIGIHDRAGRRYRRDERLHPPGRDQLVRNGRQPHTSPVGGRTAAHADEEIDHRVPGLRAVARREVDRARPRVPSSELIHDPS